MEQKTSSCKNITLFLNAMKNKKNWFFISFVTVLVTTVVIPFVLKSSQNNLFIVLGIFEVFAITFLNCMIDNSFLHTDSKLSYYKSKPVSLEAQIFTNAILNMVLAFMMMAIVTVSIIYNQAFHCFSYYTMIIPWLIVGVLVATLSSVLSGNTIVAGVVTIFNFMLPMLVFFIILFVFSILEDVVVGFSTNILMDLMSAKILKLDYIYFLEYTYRSIDIFYVIFFAALVVVLTALIYLAVRRRENENTGSFIVFDGYKYFVSVFVSLIIPAFIMTMLVYGVGVRNRVFVFIILCLLSYYLLIAILEKSFKISRLSVEIFVCCIAAFMIIVLCTVLVADYFKDYVPEAEDVNMAYIGDNIWAFSDLNGVRKEDKSSKLTEFFEYAAKYNIIIYADRDNIESITNIHRELLTDREYDYQRYDSDQAVIAYWMKDGSVVMRDYRIDTDGHGGKNSPSNAEKDRISEPVVKSAEFKKRRFPYIYSDVLSAMPISYNISAEDGAIIASGKEKMGELKACLKSDIDRIIDESDNSFEYLIMGEHLFTPYAYYSDGSRGGTYIIYLENAIGSKGIEIYADDLFTDTVEFIENIK